MQNTYYVYLHKDMEGTVFYVGRGQGDRCKLKSNRNEKHLNKMLEGYTVEYVAINVSLQEAIELESSLLLVPNKEWQLLNIARKYKKIVYDPIELKKYFKIEEKSPSGLIWNTEDAGSDFKNKIGVAGKVTSHNYYYVCFNGLILACHRIIWCLHNNKSLDNSLVIDHIDGNSLNNRTDNLQAISQRQNIKKAKKLTRKTGQNNCGWDKERIAWKVQWRENFKVKCKRFLVRGYTEDTFEIRKAEVLKEALAFSESLSIE